MSSDNEDSKNEPNNKVENEPSNTEKKVKLRNKNMSVTFTQPENIILPSDNNDNSENNELRIDEKKKNGSNFSINGDNPNFFDDELEENKVVYEIDFPPTEEEIRPKANHIKTTKYNIFTFLPLNLWSQVNIKMMYQV